MLVARLVQVLVGIIQRSSIIVHFGMPIQGVIVPGNSGEFY